jgi:hypothetical protein
MGGPAWHRALFLSILGTPYAGVRERREGVARHPQESSPVVALAAGPTSRSLQGALNAALGAMRTSAGSRPGHDAEGIT